MSERGLQITGQVIDRRTRQGVAGLRVEAWNRDHRSNELVASAITDAQGAFRMEADAAHEREAHPGTPQLYLKVWRGGELIATTEGSIGWGAEGRPVPVVIEVDAAREGEPKPFIVRGRITTPEGRPLPGVTVRAVDRDLRREELLGQSLTDDKGRYEIRYGPADFARAEKRRADLVVRVFSPRGTIWGESGTLFNAAESQMVDLTITPREEPKLSEYEHLVDSITPVLAGLPVTDLNDDDIRFMADEFAGDEVVNEKRLRILSQGARLARQTALPTEFFYGVASVREEIALPLSLTAFLALSSNTARDAVAQAGERNIVPVKLLNSLDGILARLEALRWQRRVLVQRLVGGSLVNNEIGAPLIGYRVQAFDLDAGADPKNLGFDLSDAQGRFTVFYTAAAADDAPRRLRLHVSAPDGEEIHQTEIEVAPDQKEMIVVRVEVPAVPDPAAVPLAQIATIAEVNIPADLLNFLAEHDIHTLADVRRVGSLRRLDGLSGDDPVVRVLEAHANLTLLSADVRLNQALISKGFPNLSSIANATRADFLGAFREQLGDFKAARLQLMARAQAKQLDTIFIGLQADHANGSPNELFEHFIRHGPPLSPHEAWFVPKCTCSDCEAAVSPLAYLTDLLNYAQAHLKQDKPWPLAWLTNTFHQPFGDLTASCEAMETQIRQVRVCIEVLRSHLKPVWPTLPQSVKDVFATAEKKYLWSTYTGLLGRLGTSYVEIRQAYTAPQETREALAKRLGIILNSNRPDQLDALYLVDAPMIVPLDVLSEAALEDMFGLVDTTRDPLAPGSTPKLQTWRLQHVHTLWKEQDFPSDVYAADVENRLPVIDPDVIGPDDFRKPVTGEDAFDIWIKRRAWVDARLQDLEKLKKTVNGKEVPDLKKMFTAMENPVTYSSAISGNVGHQTWSGNVKPDQFQAKYLELTAKPSPEDMEEVKAEIETELNLSVESFVRLVELWAKDQLAESEASEPVAEDEWREIYSILVQAQKRRLYVDWITEEDGTGPLFGPRTYWISLREPKEGDWPPVISKPVLAKEEPLIDPDVLALKDLPEPTAGIMAIDLWQARRIALDTKGKVLKAVQPQGFVAVLTEALGAPPATSDWDGYLMALAKELSSTDPIVRAAAQQKLKELHVTEEEFSRLMEIRANKPITIEDWTEVRSILLPAYKKKDLYQSWIQDETGFWITPGELNYRLVYKARLPRWRASAETRQAWQQALRVRSSSPIIDPDVIGLDYIKDPNSNAFKIWKARHEWISNTLLSELESHPKNLAGFEALIGDTAYGLGCDPAHLIELDEQRQAGLDIGRRLEQLSLTTAALDYLLRIHDLLAQTPPPLLLQSEWVDVYNILVQVQKRRAFAEWRAAEQQIDLFLSPDHFEVPEPPPFQFPPPEPEPLPPWRASWRDRRDWQDTLESRIEQQETTIEAIQTMASETEEETLPQLRDALVELVGKGGTLRQKARWVTDHLLIDAENDGCQLTTRVSQAIETIQGLIWSVRTGQFQGPKLVLDAEHFEEEWELIGSYPTWRAAMFVWTYPENIAIPTLRKPESQTPAFRALVKEVRNNRGLTPQDAREAAATYTAYLEDVVNMKVEAAVQASTLSWQGRVFYFGRGVSDTVYYSCYDPPGGEPYSHSFWSAIEDLANVKVLNIVGAAAYANPYGDRHIYLFLRIQEKEGERLSFITYDLSSERWTGEPYELELPEEATVFSAVVKQRSREDEAPHLAIRLPSGAIYGRHLNVAGSDWAAGDEAFDGWDYLLGWPKGKSFGELHAMVETTPGEFVLFASSANPSPRVHYRVFGTRDDGFWRPLNEAADTWVGAAQLVAGAAIYAFWNTSAGGETTSYSTLLPGPLGSSAMFNFDLFEQWLNDVTGLSLSGWTISDETLYSGMNYLDFFSIDLPHSGKEEPRPLTYPLPFWFFPALAPHQSVKAEEARKFYESRALGLIDSLVSQIESDPELRLVDQLLRRFTRAGQLAEPVSLMEVLRGLLYSKLLDWDQKEKEIKEGVGEKGEDVFLLGRVERDDVTFTLPAPMSARLDQLVQAAGKAATPPNFAVHIAHRRTSDPSGLYGASLGLSGAIIPVLKEYWSTLLAPVGMASVQITDQLSSQQIQSLRTLNATVSLANKDDPRSNREYLDEAFFFVRTHLALQLQNQGYCAEALDWFRTVYDYSAGKFPKIYYRLEEEASLSNVMTRGQDWLLDPLNPHAIAANRQHTYTRFILLSIARCCLDCADTDFTLDTSESIPRARTLYLTALRLLNLFPLKQQLPGCGDAISIIDIAIGGPQEKPLAQRMQRNLLQIGNRSVLEKVIAGIKDVMANGEAWDARYTKALQVIAQAQADQPGPPTLDVLVRGKTDVVARGQAALLSHPTVSEALAATGKTVANAFSLAISQVTGQNSSALDHEPIALPWLHAPLASSGESTEGSPLFDFMSGVSGGSSFGNESQAFAQIFTYKETQAFPLGPFYYFCVPPNPIIEVLRLHAELNLYKIRTCRNIAGMERQVEPYAAATDTVSGLPYIGSSDQLVLPGTVTLQPTPYRYSVLIERAKQFAQMAAQFEGAMLATFEKRDAEAYQMVKARQDVELRRAGVRLQELRVREVESGVDLAELQQERAQIQVDYYDGLLSTGRSPLEEKYLQRLTESMFVPDSVSTGPEGETVSWSPSGKLQTAANILSTLANWERRKQEWEFQKSLAQQDVRIGAQQVRLAKDQVRVVGQERKIAQMEANHATETRDFLANKFTNAELYDWMSRELAPVYRFFLRHGTAVAKLAENAVAFERQEVPPAIIQADYWTAPTEGVGAGDSKAPDRRGLTGSARLLRDIFELDQHAFETEKRKLQLTKTISLARLDPYTFERFRETGLMLFDTPMELFDWDFPGHYLRLIKRVRTSVVALIPPMEGIRATLSTIGLSSVVINSSGLYQTVAVKRSPESVALTSPINATGLFELTPQPGEMLLPFEGMGVDTSWELRMPKASNQFDYRTIADVLLTIEYTALGSFAYRQQVIQRLDTDFSADRPFSFRHQIADPWYDLHNPEQTATPMVVRFNTRREDFPPNVDDLKIQQVVLYFARKDGASFEMPVAHLHFTAQEGGGTVGGESTSVDGVISTRKGNAASWTAMLGKSPIGEWELALPNTAAIKNRFKAEEIEDMLFVITYKGHTPAWPA